MRKVSFFDLLKQMREDWWFNGESYFTPGFQALATHRFGVWQKGLPRVPRALLEPVYRALFIFVRNFYGIELPRETVVGRRVRFSHQNGMVIHPSAKIGDECTIRHNVTIGAATRERLADAPVLGRNVQVGAGAVIVGKVVIGDGARIGPNAVVMTNVPAGATVFAPAPRVIQMQGDKRLRQDESQTQARSEGHDNGPDSTAAAPPEESIAGGARKSDWP